MPLERTSARNGPAGVRKHRLRRQSAVMVASIGKIVSPARVPVGDERQLGAVEAGKPFRQIRAAGMTTTVKDDIVRQGASGSAIRHASGVGRVIMPRQENARAWACSGGAGVSRIASRDARADGGGDGSVGHLGVLVRLVAAH